MSITVKKIKLLPIGDKNEVDRVYQYVHNAMYSSYIASNRLISQIGLIYYDCDRDFKSDKFKEETRKIYRASNPAFEDIDFPKGLGMNSNVIRCVQQDFSKALKGGLAKGNRNFPFYKRNNPFYAPSRFFKFSEETEIVIDEEGREKEKSFYKIKWVNKINFRVALSGYGRNTDSIRKMLNDICHNSDKIKVCDSKMRIEGKYIYLYLTVKYKEEEKTELDKDVVMGVSMGLDNPCICALNNSDKEIVVGERTELLERRILSQHRYESIMKNLTKCRGGRGRAHKLQAMEKYKNNEKNYMRTYNHTMSKKIVDEALKNKASVIIIEDLSKLDKEKNRLLLRNWTYYQQQQMILYKAKRYGIKVISCSTDNPENICSECGCVNEPRKEEEIVKRTEQLSFICSHCNCITGYDYNKAKVMSQLG